MLAAAPFQLNRIDFKTPPGTSEGNYITNKLILLKWLIWLRKGYYPETPIWNTILN